MNISNDINYLILFYNVTFLLTYVLLLGYYDFKDFENNLFFCYIKMFSYDFLID